jgi:hypothetical protein
MIARPVELFHFHNLTLTVVEADAVHFVALKPVVEMLGITWRRAREHVLEAENTALFGIKTLNPTPTDAYLGEPGEFFTPNGVKKEATKGQIFIRLDRVHLYLARVNTAQMRANGNEAAADRLLALQQEWASALYQYETHGIAVKAGQHKSLKDLFAMRQHASGEERERLTFLIGAALDAMGSPRQQNAQGALFGGEA